jgi:hypothetical protein
MSTAAHSLAPGAYSPPVETGEQLRRGRLLVVATWAASRLIVFASAAVVQVLGLSGVFKLGPFSGHPFALLRAWDGHWYQLVAHHGYLLVQGQTSNPAFFPLLPVLLHVTEATGIPSAVAGLLIANGVFLIALLGFYELSRTLLPEPDARRASLYLAIFPFGFVFSMVYPESLTLAAFAFAALFASRGRWLACGVCGSLAALSRPEGVLIAVPLLVLAWRFSDRGRIERTRAVAAALAAPATLAAVALFFWIRLGDPLAWQTAESAWGRSFRPTGFYQAAHELWIAIVRYHQSLWLFRDAGFCALYMLLLFYAYRKGLPRDWILAGAAIVLVPLASGSFTSDARFGLLALPVFWALAILGRNTRIHRLVLTLSPPLVAACVFSTVFRWP